MCIGPRDRNKISARDISQVRGVRGSRDAQSTLVPGASMIKFKLASLTASLTREVLVIQCTNLTLERVPTGRADYNSARAAPPVVQGVADVFGSIT